MKPSRIVIEQFLAGPGAILGAFRSALVSTIGQLQRRTVGRAGVVVLALLVATAPYILFFDPVDYWPRRGHEIGRASCRERV